MATKNRMNEDCQTDDGFTLRTANDQEEVEHSFEMEETLQKFGLESAKRSSLSRVQDPKFRIQNTIKETCTQDDNLLKENASIAKKNTSRIRKTVKIRGFLIFPDDGFKDIWGLFMTIMLLYSTIITPYKLAFFDSEPMGWLIADIVVDIFFAADLILQFFISYYDSNQDLVTNRKLIAIHYIKSWFFLDLIALLPFNYMIESSESSKDYSSLARLSRLPRLYRLVKVTKLLRTLRMIRDRKTVKQNLNWFILEKYMKMGANVERFISFCLFYFILCHVSACLFYLVAKIEGIHPNSWVVEYGYQDSSNIELYTVSFYYTITTITTVGYGDITPKTVAERWFSTCVLIFGVMSYSFAISSISTWMTTSDAQDKNVKQDMNTLNSIDLAYNLDNEIYIQLKKLIILRNRNDQHLQDTQMFINKFPRKIKRELNTIIHTCDLRKIDIFKEMKEKFITAVAKEIKIIKRHRDEYIYKKGEEIDGIYFIGKGKVEMVLPEYHNRSFVQISSGYEFGELDFLEDQTIRSFTVRAVEDCELLHLPIGSLHSLIENYDQDVMKFFRGSESKLIKVRELEATMTKKLRTRTQKLGKKLVMAIVTAKSRKDTKFLDEDVGNGSSFDDSMSDLSYCTSDESVEMGDADLETEERIHHITPNDQESPKNVGHIKNRQDSKSRAEKFHRRGNIANRKSMLELANVIGNLQHIEELPTISQGNRLHTSRLESKEAKGRESSPPMAHTHSTKLEKKLPKLAAYSSVGGLANLCGSLLQYRIQNKKDEGGWDFVQGELMQTKSYNPQVISVPVKPPNKHFLDNWVASITEKEEREESVARDIKN